MNLDIVSKIKEEISEQVLQDELSANAVAAKCISCGDSEFDIALDSSLPLDEFFLSNYFCDDCEFGIEDKAHE